MAIVVDDAGATIAEGGVANSNKSDGIEVLAEAPIHHKSLHKNGPSEPPNASGWHGKPQKRKGHDNV